MKIISSKRFEDTPKYLGEIETIFPLVLPFRNLKLASFGQHFKKHQVESENNFSRRPQATWLFDTFELIVRWQHLLVPVLPRLRGKRRRPRSAGRRRWPPGPWRSRPGECG